MSTSGSSDFTRTRDQLIHRALRLCGAIKAGETPGAQEITDGAEALNAMVKRWQKKQLHVWAVVEATLFPQVSQVKYNLSSSSTDHVTETYYETGISTAAASGATTLDVDETTNITAGDYIGVVVDDGTVHWTTVSSKTSTTVTIATALDDDAAVGNPVFTYTTKLVRPLKIVDARRYNIASGQDTPISETQGSMMSRLDYQAIPNKAQTGSINRAFYDPGRDTGYLYLWQPVSVVRDLVKMTCHRPIMDFDAAGDTPDLPQEWFDAIVYNLAVSIGPEYDVPAERWTIVKTQAAEYLDDVAGDDREGESLFFGVDMG